ncbi:unnamed protein product [Peniophora sp. CBMAI 1063]|nr:unnamed protein product [Peniophora sp. CBMAI 1063]
MGWFSGWFQKSESEDYEVVLAALKADIEKRRIRLSELRLRERRTTLASTLYALAGWGLYVSLWYMEVLPRPGFSTATDQLLRGAPVFIGPILVLLVRRLVQLWYKRKGDAEEKALRELSKQQHTKIEEIKKKTNYYQMREMMAKYDETPGSGAPASPAPRQPQQPQPQQPLPATPQRRPIPQQVQQRPIQGSPNPLLLQTPLRPGLQSQLMPSPPQPLPPPRKQWYDKLADAILGDDETAAASRYALICQKCFTHNGLVEASRYEEMQYTCPKCGHFNPSPRTLKQGGSKSPVGRSPVESSPVSPSPSPSISQANGPPVARAARGPSGLRKSTSSTPIQEEGDSSLMDVDGDDSP